MGIIIKMKKLSYMKSSTQNFLEYFRQPTFEDKFLANKAVEFKHSWSQLAHMHDLRLWTITYAPMKKNNLQRLQEVHYLNQEMWYQTYNALWKRFFAGIALWFFVTRVKGSTYMKRRENDSHDAHWRDTAAH